MYTNKSGDYYHTKCIALKRPNKYLLAVLAINVLLAANNNWIMKGVSDTIFWIISSISIVILLYSLYIYGVYYVPKSLKKITINGDYIVLEFYYIKDRTTNSHDYITQKCKLKVVVKGNKMELLDDGKYIAKVYKSMIKDKNDWEWLINYLGDNILS